MTLLERQKKIIFQLFGPNIAPNVINGEFHSLDKKFVQENLKIPKIGDIFKNQTLENGKKLVDTQFLKEKIFNSEGYKELNKLIKQKVSSAIYTCYKCCRECDDAQVYCNSCMNWMHSKCEYFKDDGSGESNPYFCKRCQTEFKTYY